MTSCSDIVVIPYPSAMGAYQTPDIRKGTPSCPTQAAANSKLLQKTFTTTKKSLLVLTGHMIARTTGRADLQLYISGVKKDDTLTYTPSKQWAQAAVFWSGVIEAGTHTAWLQSPQANIWGCASNYGDM